MTDEKELQFAHALLLAELLRRHRDAEVKDTLPEDDTNRTERKPMTRHKDRFADGNSQARQREERAQDTRQRIAEELKRLAAEKHKNAEVAALEEAERIIEQQREQLPKKPGGYAAAWSQPEEEKADRRGYNGTGRPPWA